MSTDVVPVTAVGGHTRGNPAAESDLTRPWPWPRELFVAVENYLVRPLGPTPRRVLPPDPNSAPIAQVVSTRGELDRLVARRPPLWAWAAFVSSLLQQHNRVISRLRDCASGYQPRPGAPLSATAYAGLASEATHRIAEHRVHLQGLLRGPVFAAFVNDATNGRPIDPSRIWHIADQLMGYHSSLLSTAEMCIHTPVARGATVLAQDTSTLVVCPLVSFAEFIVTLSHQVAETRELIAYSQGRPIAVDCPDLVIGFPRGLNERIIAQIKRFAR